MLEQFAEGDVTESVLDVVQRKWPGERELVDVGQGAEATPSLPAVQVSERPRQRPPGSGDGVQGWLVDLLRARQVSAASAEEPLVPDALGAYWDRNNVESAFRAVRSGTAFECMVPHTYRKTVATWMDAEGLSPRTIADQFGHSRISMTQDVYMSRRLSTRLR